MSLLPTAISRPLVDIARFIDPHERAGGLAHHDAVDSRELLEWALLSVVSTVRLVATAVAAMIRSCAPRFVPLRCTWASSRPCASAVSSSYGSTGKVSNTFTQLGHRDGGDHKIILLRDDSGQLGARTLGCDQYPGVGDQPAGHAGPSSTATSRAARTSAAKPSSVASAFSSARTSAPLPAPAGPMVAIRRPPRVTTTTCPRSASSMIAANERLASVAVRVRMAVRFGFRRVRQSISASQRVVAEGEYHQRLVVDGARRTLDMSLGQCGISMRRIVPA